MFSSVKIAIRMDARNEHLTVTLPEGWLEHHPLGKELK